MAYKVERVEIKTKIRRVIEGPSTFGVDEEIYELFHEHMSPIREAISKIGITVFFGILLSKK